MGKGNATTSKLKQADGAVSALRSSLRLGEKGFSHVSGLIKQILERDYWKERLVYMGVDGDVVVRFERFDQFVTTDPPKGIGSTIEHIRGLCKADFNTLNLFDKATQQGPGGDKKSEDYKIITNNSSNDLPRQTIQGTTAQSALRRLRKDAPELLQRVLDDPEYSPHKAMIDAGFRKETITITLEPAAAARTIRKRFTRKQLRELIALLSEST